MDAVPAHKKYDLWLICLAGIAAVVMVLATTAPYGAGVSGDSVYYLSGAQNIAAGNGYFDHFGNPIVKFPPLYTYLLAAISWATGLTPLWAGTYLNALAFGLMVVLSGLLFRRDFDNKVLVIMGTLAVLFCRSFFNLGINIFSDPLFFVLCLLFLLLLPRYMQTGSTKTLLLLSLVTALALLQRYIALALVLTGIFAIFLKHYKHFWRAITLNLLYGGLSSLPLAGWILFRNVLTYGEFIGSRSVTRVLFWQNSVDALQRMAYWFLPVSLLDRVPWWSLLLVLLAALALVNKRAQWSAFASKLRQPDNLVLAVFTLVYFLLVVGTTFSADHYGPYDDRYIAIIYVPLVWLSLLVLQQLVLPHLQKHANTLIILAFVVWLVYPVNSVRKFAVQSYQEGVVLYNIFNVRWFHESSLIEELKPYPFQADIPLYSNYADTVFMYLGRSAQRSLQDTRHYTAQAESLNEELGAWPPGGTAYLVWFNYPTFSKNYYTPQQLAEVLQVTTLYEDQDGGLYLVETHP